MFSPSRSLREGDVNAFLATCGELCGFELVERVLDYFNASYIVTGRELERMPADGPLVIVVDRTLSLIDAALVLRLVRQVRSDVRVLANDRLLALPGMRPLLVPATALRNALDRHEAVIGGLPAVPADDTPVLPVAIARITPGHLLGLAALFRTQLTARVRIGEPVAARTFAEATDPASFAREVRRAAKAGGGKLVAFARGAAPVAQAEDRRELKRELARAECLGETSDGKAILVLDAAPESAVLRELGRLREIAFRQVGEGTGKRRDIDAHDAYYRHLVLWDDAELRIAGAYRIGECARILDTHGEHGLYTRGLFEYSDTLRALLPEAIELGRSFVQARYQGLRALEYLWQGIGAYLRARPHLRYLFGPVSLSATLPEAARQAIVHFFGTHCAGPVGMATARLPCEIPAQQVHALAARYPGRDYARELRVLKDELGSLGASIPVLYKQYAELTEPGGTRFLAFNIDPAFSHCIDGLVLVDLMQLKAGKRARYLDGVAPPRDVAAALRKSA
jgi:putative hemolysin